ncbi:MAG: hypothetical protein WCF65_01310 [Parachlamydiaceae bacterium]
MLSECLNLPHRGAAADHMQCSAMNKTASQLLLEKNYQSQADSTISREGHDFPIQLVPGAKGAFYQVYTLKPNEYQLVPGVPNEKIIVKMPKEELCDPARNTMRAKEARRDFETWLTNAKKQYDEIKGTLRVVNIHSNILEDGFFIEEKITPLNGSNYCSLWNREFVSKEAAPVLAQIKPFFDYALKDQSYLALDLRFDNFGVSENGDVVLVDFREIELDKEFPVDIPYRTVAGDNLKGCAQSNLEVVAYFCTSIKGTELYNYLMGGNSFKDHEGPWSWEA